jgi:hypothetical protein
MSQLDRTHDHSADFDQSLHAVLGLAWLLTQIDALGPVSGTAGLRAERRAPSSSFSEVDPASLAVLGVIAVACELRPMLEALSTGSQQRPKVKERAGQRGEIGRVEPEVRSGARLNQRERDRLLR